MPGRSGTVYKNWLAERGKDSPAGVRIATLDPLPGTARTPSLGLLQGRNQRARRLSHRHTRRGTTQVRYAAASSKTRPVTADAGGGIASTKSGFSCAPHVTSSPLANKNDSTQPSQQMRRISVSKSPTTAPSTCETSSTKPHPPTADTWPLASSRTYQRVPSPKSPD